MLIIDEYQDIELELAQMLDYIKYRNPGMQIIAVGDMQQKIYDKTTLDVPSFINNFLEEYELLELSEHDSMLMLVNGFQYEGTPIAVSVALCVGTRMNLIAPITI